MYQDNALSRWLFETHIAQLEKLNICGRIYITHINAPQMQMTGIATLYT